MTKTIYAALSAVLLAFGPTTARATQPDVPPLVRIIVPFSPGASTDVIARLIASQLGPRLNTNVIVENRPGASGMIGSNFVAKGPKDGSTLLFTSISTISTAATTRNAPFDVTTDLVPIAIPNSGPLVIAVSSKTDIKTPADLVAQAKAHPDELTHGTAGVGTIAHLAAELLNETAQIQLKHIPYKGASLAVSDTAGGVIDMMFAANTTFDAQIKAGRMRPIAVTSDKPSPAFPDLPPMSTVAPGYSVELWTVLFAPAGTPPELVQKLNHEVNEIAQSKEVLDLMKNDGATSLSLTPAQSAAKVQDAYATWKRLSQTKNIVLE